MRTFNLHYAKTHLSQLVDEVANGDPFVIAQRGKPMVQVIPVANIAKPKRRIGFLKGQFRVPDDIKTPFAAEIEEMFYGEK